MQPAARVQLHHMPRVDQEVLCIELAVNQCPYKISMTLQAQQTSKQTDRDELRLQPGGSLLQATGFGTNFVPPTRDHRFSRANHKTEILNRLARIEVAVAGILGDPGSGVGMVTIPITTKIQVGGSQASHVRSAMERERGIGRVVDANSTIGTQGEVFRTHHKRSISYCNRTIIAITSLIPT